MVCAVAKVVYGLDDDRQVVPSGLPDLALVRVLNERFGHLNICLLNTVVTQPVITCDLFPCGAFVS